MRFLVTGAAGFIGQHLTRELLASGHDVHGWDSAWGEGHDILKWPDLLRERLRWGRYDAVIHLAAQVGRLFGEDDVRHSVDSNAGMTALVARMCGDLGVRMVYASTSEVYGDQGDRVCREDDDHRGHVHNIYGLSKRWGEEACALYAPDGLTIWRISMPYGPGLPAGRGRAAMINFLYNALHGLPIQVHRDSERSWCWIGDTVRAMRLTLERTVGGTFNVGRDDQPFSMLEIARRACDITGAPHKLIREVDPPARQTVVKRLSTDRIRALGWEPHIDLDEGMKRTLEWVVDQPIPESGYTTPRYVRAVMGLGEAAA